MLQTLDLYYFSPTGGTRKVGEILAAALAQHVTAHDLTAKGDWETVPQGDLTVIAMPVFGGRIPALAAKKLSILKGSGKKAVTLAVYGTRAYEDALLELNDVTKAAGFQIAASGAFIARHSIVPEVGADRPDAQDAEELKTFAQNILEKLAAPFPEEPAVPGKTPYKEFSSLPVAPLSLENCNLCGHCATICPYDATTIEGDILTSDAEKCTLCMACVYGCPASARILPPQVQETMNTKLGQFKDVRRENEFFI